MTTVETDIVKRGNLADLVKSYDAAIKKVEQAYGILIEAEKELKDAFVVHERYDTDFGTLPGRNRNSTENVGDNLKKVKDVIKRKAWNTLYQSLEIDRIASIKRRDEIYKLLDDGQLPEITLQSVYEMFEMLTQSINTFAKESVFEVYQWLRPSDEYYEMKKYKTNQKNARFELGLKVVKTGMIEKNFGGNFRVNHWNEKYLIALDKVFHMLDGKNMMEKSYRGALVDAINASECGSCSTDYFFCRMYRNGNLHIEFLRSDLVQQFNAIAGDGTLKPVT